MLYGQDGCRGDVEFADSTRASLKKITQEIKKSNQLKEAELWIQLGDDEKAKAILEGK